jgi:PAS domain S-box-containing protein
MTTFSTPPDSAVNAPDVVIANGAGAPLRTEQELREYADRMAEAEQIVGFGVWRWEIATGRVLWSNELHRIYGLKPGGFGGTVEGFVSFLHPEDRERVWGDIESAMSRREPFAFNERIVRSDGEVRTLLSQGRPVIDADGTLSALVGVCHDVTERVETERALGLSERRMRAILEHTPAVVAVKDLDGRYLMTNAETGRLVDMPPDALIGRECTELFPTIAEQLRANDRLAAAGMEPVYDEAVLEKDGEARTFLTITFALPDESGRPVETCTIAADVTERRERENERRERLDWAKRIDSALHDGRMLVVAQPVVDLKTDERTYFELLLRMGLEDDGGILHPNEFLPAAERFGLVQSIDIWMVGRALGLAADLMPELNISAVTLCDPGARREIIRLLDGDPAAARRIVFEITETAAADHLDSAREFAAELTALGCGLALDDFGTGFGSFTYLRDLPLRYLKIDASFVQGLGHSKDDRRVVQSIIGIAEQFELMTIAEGVEDEGTLELLRELGADYAQGFHLGRPGAIPGDQPGLS